MTVLKQIIFIIFSFSTGFIYSYFIRYITNKFYNITIYKKVVVNLIYIVLFIAIYFALLVKINNGIVHYYSIILFALGIIANFYIKNM